MDILKDIELDELPQEQKNLINLIGAEAFSALVDVYGGMNVYIPKKDSFVRATRNEEIRRKFDGCNYRKLAIEYGLTETAIRLIVAEVDQEMRKKPIDGQVALF
ncbi:MAG: DNA-binding protein [Clostridia bacterium]|nr:DNA-binding protein [Clostridia bacterium]